MSKGFNYSKWDNIELSDDEDDVHPNIDRESWFRMKHRSRVEREEREEVDKKRMDVETASTNLRIKEIRSILKRLSNSNDDDSDDELEDEEGLEAELAELLKCNTEREKKLEDYEKNKKWNVDNLCHVVEERTMINPKGMEPKFNKAGYAVPDSEIGDMSLEDTKAKPSEPIPAAATSNESTKIKPEKSPTNKTQKAAPPPKTEGPSRDQIAMLSYAQFTDKYSPLLEEFMTIRPLDGCKSFLLLHGDMLLQENASNYLLLASLEDEMNGLKEKMRLTARQSQLMSNITELAKSLNQHPGNVIAPFFMRLEEKEHLKGFTDGVEVFIKRIQERAVVKKKEMDAQRKEEEEVVTEVDLKDVPKEERLGPGGLDPVEVFESLPESMQEAFESRDTEELKRALLDMEVKEAEYHMKRCVDAGLWNDSS